MIAPLNIGAIEGFKAAGIDLLGERRDTMPPEYVRRIEEGYRLSVTDIGRDQEMRTTVNDAVQAAVDQYDVLVTPTLCRELTQSTVSVVASEIAPPITTPHNTFMTAVSRVG